jgi:hypothetical protein
MKRVLIIVALVSASMVVQAQNVRLGLSGGINSTWLMNKNVFDQNDGLDIAASFGGRIGIDAIYSFSEKVGVSVGVNFLSSHNQKYTGDATGIDGDLTVKLKYLDIPILFRLTSTSGTYFEIGPQFGILNSAKETYEGNSTGFDYDNISVKNGFETTNIAAILGFGVDIDVTDNIFITTGLRLGYGISDVTKEFSSPLNLVLGTNSAATEFAHMDDDGQFNYEKTSRVFGGLHLGVSYKFGGN